MKTAQELIENIDFAQLKAQKEALLHMSDSKEVRGLINLVDSIQDFAVDVLGKDEKEVFNLEDDEAVEVVVEKSCKWDVPISRIGYSGRVQEIRVDEPITEEEAINLAIDEAGGESFSEHTSEYEAPDGAIKL